MVENPSRNSTDMRPIRQIVYEKATFGAMPTHYKVYGDTRWHPVQFVSNPELLAVSFSDGSEVQVAESKPDDDTDFFIRATTADGTLSTRHPLPELDREGDDDDDTELQDMLSQSTTDAISDDVRIDEENRARVESTLTAMKPEVQQILAPTLNSVESIQAELNTSARAGEVIPTVERWDNLAVEMYAMHRELGYNPLDSYFATNDDFLQRKKAASADREERTAKPEPESDPVATGLGSFFDKSATKS